MGRETAHVDHTFRSGWTATIWRHLPMQWLMQQALEEGRVDVADALLQLTEDGQLTGRQGVMALQIERDIVQALFVRPRVVWDRDALPPDWDATDPDRDPVWAGELTDDELAECLELALRGVAELGRFRGDTGGTEDGAGSADVEQPTKPPRRTTTRKR